MIPNNNLSVLPWYSSVEEQNARKWWIYGKVYPLFTPAGYILPFQIMRPNRLKFSPIAELDADDYSEGYLTQNGEWMQDVGNDYGVSSYDVTGMTSVVLGQIPQPYPGGVVAAAKDNNGNVLGIFSPVFQSRFTGGWKLPNGTTTLYVQTYNRNVETPGIYAEIYEASYEIAPVESLDIYTKEGAHVVNIDPETMGFSVVAFENLGYDVIVFPGQLPVLAQMNNGQYYAVLSDETETWYSEVFTVVNDMSGYLKLEWWDNENFVMDAGTIVYANPQFKNILYLCSDIAKPEYDFDDQVIERGGYTFPVQQISKKRYRFSFLASEYLLDVMRFVRMADYAQVTKHGQTYTLDTFLITPEWEDNGDVAAVDAEFTTATVAKKIGVGYIKAQRGDYNDDFNEDYNNE